MVLAGQHFSAYVPYAARWPLEVHLKRMKELKEDADVEVRI
jgi:galactose-1-phosphate uridylyltransferase